MRELAFAAMPDLVWIRLKMKQFMSKNKMHIFFPTELVGVASLKNAPQKLCTVSPMWIKFHFFLGIKLKTILLLYFQLI